MFWHRLRAETPLPIPRLSWPYKVSIAPIEAPRWNGFSLFGIPGRFKEPPVCLPVCVHICGGVLSRPDRWLCTTGQRWVENIHSLYRSANSGNGSSNGMLFFLLLLLLLYWAWDKTGREDGEEEGWRANVAWKIVCYEAILAAGPRATHTNTHSLCLSYTQSNRRHSMQNVASVKHQ